MKSKKITVLKTVTEELNTSFKYSSVKLITDVFNLELCYMIMQNVECTNYYQAWGEND